MASSTTRLDFSSNSDAARYMVEGLVKGIRDSLRARVLEAIEPNIEAAIEDALKTFKASIEGYRQHDRNRDVISVLIEHKHG